MSVPSLVDQSLDLGLDSEQAMRRTRRYVFDCPDEELIGAVQLLFDVEDRSSRMGNGS